ncbi:MAG: hypothetical protein AAGE65_01845 [Planctomycetota bacterium]
MSETPSTSTPDRPATIAGPWAVAATLSLFVVVPAVVFVAWQVMEADFADVEREPLVWSQRTTWRAYDVKAKPLEHGVMSQARTGKTYKDYGFAPTEDLVASIARCRALAESGAAFFTGDTHEALIAEWESVEGHFYAAGLLALWYADAVAATGDALGAEAAEEWWTRAFAAAPAALVQSVQGTGGAPAAGQNVGTIAIAFDTVDPEADAIDTELVLVFPGVRTDANGGWYLPIFKTIFRVIDPALGPPVPNDPQQSVWLTHVGGVGRLPVLTAD